MCTTRMGDVMIAKQSPGNFIFLGPVRDVMWPGINRRGKIY